LAQVRELKGAEMLRIGARDLAHRGTLMEIVGEISDLADVCLETVWQVCTEQLVARYGSRTIGTAADAGNERALACWAWENWAAVSSTTVQTWTCCLCIARKERCMRSRLHLS
jgi:hypothetical protein